ncbi:uncharacterized protein [Mytilus edulis]|uniref:uncharacterized protein n=1 Tax=Mytilus edulis TaxID=6550 RepID=UPI0039EE3A1A
MGNTVEKKRINVFDAEDDAEPPRKSLKVQQGQVATKTVCKGTNKKEEDTEDLGQVTTEKEKKKTNQKDEGKEEKTRRQGTAKKETKKTDKKEEDTDDLGQVTTEKEKKKTNQD